MRVSLILFIILSQFTNGYLVNTNFKPKQEIKRSISRKQCLNLIGTSLILIPIKKANAIDNCDINVVVEHNKNIVLEKDIAFLEYGLLYQYILLFIFMINVVNNFY